jgi:hypothetical protein
MTLLRLLAAALLFCSFPAFAGQELYVPPRALNISLELEKVDADGHHYKASVESLIGTALDARCYFEASENIVLKDSMHKIDKLEAGKPDTFSLVAVPTASQAADPSAWVRLRVEYLPDYSAISARISSDSSSYPDKNLREQLLLIVNQNMQASARAVDAVRRFLAAK